MDVELLRDCCCAIRAATEQPALQSIVRGMSEAGGMEAVEAMLAAAEMAVALQHNLQRQVAGSCPTTSNQVDNDAARLLPELAVASLASLCALQRSSFEIPEPRALKAASATVSAFSAKSSRVRKWGDMFAAFDRAAS